MKHMARLATRLLEHGLAVRVRAGRQFHWKLTARGKRALELLDRDPHASVAQLLRELERGEPLGELWPGPPLPAWLR
jgi:hypothetical protein